MAVFTTLTTGGAWWINKPLARYFNSIQTVVVLMELIFHSDKHKDADRWFFYQTERLEDICIMGSKMRRKCFDQLVKSGILKIEKRGIPCRFWYQLDAKRIDEIIENETTSPSPEGTTGDSPGDSTGDSPGDSTIIKKGTKKIEEEVIEERVSSSLASDASAISDFCKSDGCHFKRLKSDRMINIIKIHYGNYLSFKSNFDLLWNHYLKLHNWNKAVDRDKYLLDLYSYIENAMIKEALRK